MDVSGDGGVLKKVRRVAKTRSKGCVDWLISNSSNIGNDVRSSPSHCKRSSNAAHLLWYRPLSFRLLSLSLVKTPSGVPVHDGERQVCLLCISMGFLENIFGYRGVVD